MEADAAELAGHQRVIDFIAGKVPPAKWDRADKGSDVAPSGCVEISVLYINLDSHADRREHIEKQLEMLAVPYQRIPAIWEHYGPMGCLKSHIKALRVAREKRCLWTVVFEDDFGFQCPGEDAMARIRFVLENSTLAPVWLGDWAINGPQPSKHSMYRDVKMANGACNRTSCYLVRHDYIDVLLGTWETALANLVIDLRRRVEDKRAKVIEEISPLWWYSPDVAWVPLQIRDRWLLFDPKLGTQQTGEFGSSLHSSITNFENTGFLEVALNEITTHIA